MLSPTRPESLRVLCLDGGGIKGYTSLLILKRIFRTMMAEGQFEEMQKPCDVFDLIIGTSTGGLIAVMLGRLHMTIDECIAKYEQVGKEVFGKKIQGGKLGKMIKGLRSSSFYDIGDLQDEVRKILDMKEIPEDTAFQEPGVPLCKVMLCVTRTEINKPDVLRNYESFHPTVENYSCTVWEAASATAAAPLFFKAVQFNGTGEKWCDGGLRRNNPIHEALSELPRERDWKDKKIGCVLSLGTGLKKSETITSNLASVVKAAVAIMTDSDDIAQVFATSELGIELYRTHRYFRFSVPQGMEDLQLDEWKETERMKALTSYYLGHVGNGDLLMRCAKSLLDPDENLQIDIKTKISLIPYYPCTHFIDRRVYSETLLKFFRSKTQLAQTFVLWGLGGTGKTQIALKFAQNIRHRISVFWIRADRFPNFATDYAQVLKELDPASVESNSSSTDLSVILDNTRRKLEQNPNEWLLILDNADDLDAFLGRSPLHDDDDGLSLSRFLPRHGRMLITTRDRRFQGMVGAANDGLRVDSMSEEEAKELLIGSIPGYLIREGSDSMIQAKQLIEELGYLPLAIAQAAANILEQQLTLGEYVSFYHDKKQRMGLMRAPAHDFRTTDPRNASQSVNITWQISFDVLKEKYPLSAIFLTYIGCLHWRNIPRMLLQQLPEFRDLPGSEFIQLTKKPLNLSLLNEEETEPGYTEYAVHPLVHENIVRRLAPEEISAYVQRLVDLTWTIFPYVKEKSDPDWNIGVYLAPHAARMIELSEDVHSSSKSLSILLLRMSQFSGVSYLFSAAVDLANKAKAMGWEEWSSSPELLMAFSANASSQYQNASRYKEAELVAREALEWIDSDFIKANLDPGKIELQKIHLRSILAMSLWGSKNHAEREILHRQQLATGLINEWDAEGINIRHNLAHALFHQRKFEEARSVNTALLGFAVTEAGKKEVSPRLYLIMLNLRCMIIRVYATTTVYHEQTIQQEPSGTRLRDEQLQIYRLVFKESLEQLGNEDIDTWKAVNNLIGCLSLYSMLAECGPILWQVLPGGIAAKIKAEGNFKITLQNVTDTAQLYLEYLEASRSQDAKATEEFRKLFQEWLTTSGCSCENIQSPDNLNSKGVGLQHKGLFKEAEQHHAKSIQVCQEGNDEVADVYVYNLMLAIGRQGRLEDAMALRESYGTVLESQEAAFGTLEQRIERDRRDREIYEEAQALIDTGQLTRDGEWWLANERELGRGEWRYGELKPRLLPESQRRKHRIGKQGAFKLAMRFKAGNNRL